jgi:SOS response associated peptidase (SRAP)
VQSRHSGANLDAAGAARRLLPRGGDVHVADQPKLGALSGEAGAEVPPSDSGFERFNIAPTQEVLAVVDDRDGRRIEKPRWGFVPHWAKELNTRLSMINAPAYQNQLPAGLGTAKAACPGG